MNSRSQSLNARTYRGPRNRYDDFVNQRNPRKAAVKKMNAPKSGQGMINFLIFVILFLAILTLFGFGLSRLNDQADTTSVSISQACEPREMLPPPTILPSGHSEILRKVSSNRVN